MPQLSEFIQTLDPSLPFPATTASLVALQQFIAILHEFPSTEASHATILVDIKRLKAALVLL
ncbi:hypothetical protein ACXWOO_10870, partial [Streptococcus pyogenes]